MTYPNTKALLEHYRKNQVFPGYSAAFLLPDNQVEKLVVGQAQLSPQVEELRDGLYYDLASLTKVLVTTTLVLQLLENGKLDIDSSISTYFPQAKEPKGPCATSLPILRDWKATFPTDLACLLTN